jgi:hypothetical protein
LIRAQLVPQLNLPADRLRLLSRAVEADRLVDSEARGAGSLDAAPLLAFVHVLVIMKLSQR